ERIHDRGRRIRQHQHVAVVDRLPAADRRAVEAEPVLQAGLEPPDRIRDVLPGAREVDELAIDHHGPVLLGVLQDVTWLHRASLCSAPCPARGFVDCGSSRFRQIASSPVSPVRMRMTSSTGVTKILPSPMRPVRAASVMVATTCRTLSSGTMISSLTLGTESTTWAEPRYTSFLRPVRPKPFTSVTVMPCTPISDRLSLTSSSL